ncbi:hypothetical protein HU200_037329 [Digitaria exilis]|uniref:Uncharacterized protein n=1 Tax=Digitaria exilis TaxID=1010633 RepID=A0A835BEA0_9POAL|nr:hypothetical protein HU200_037329 [Digitaria exilis]
METNVVSSPATNAGGRLVVIQAISMKRQQIAISPRFQIPDRGKSGPYVTSAHKQNGATRGDAVHARGMPQEYIKGGQAASQSENTVFAAKAGKQMDAMDELQEADILWPDTEDDDDDELVPFATTMGGVAMEVTPGSVLGRHLRGERFFHPGPSSSSAAASPDDQEEEWLEADVLWPDTVGVGVVPRGGGGGGLLLPFPGGSGRRGNLAADRRERWRAAASSPIDIPTNVAAARRLNLGRR